MKMELKMLETNDSSVASVWKKKCIELFEVCTSLKEENGEVRTLCNDLIVQGIHLTDAIHTQKPLDTLEQTDSGHQYLMKRSMDAIGYARHHGNSDYAVSPVKK